MTWEEMEIQIKFVKLKLLFQDQRIFTLVTQFFIYLVLTHESLIHQNRLLVRFPDYNNNLVHSRLRKWVAHVNHLYPSHCWLLLPWLRVPCWLFCNLGCKLEPLPRFELATLDLRSQSGDFDHSAMVTPFFRLVIKGLFEAYFQQSFLGSSGFCLCLNKTQNFF